MADQEGRELGLAQAQADPVAGNPRLGDLELCIADLVPVADAHLAVGQPVDREILPEVAVAEIIAPEVLLPVPVGIDLVDQHRPLLTAVAVQVALAVPVDIQPPHHPRSCHRVLPDAGADGPALPGHVLRHADVDRHQHRHGITSFRSLGCCRRRAGHGHRRPPGGASSRLSSRSMPCGITLWPGSSRSRLLPRLTSTSSGSNEIKPATRPTSGQAFR